MTTPINAVTSMREDGTVYHHMPDRPEEFGDVWVCVDSGCGSTLGGSRYRLALFARTAS